MPAESHVSLNAERLENGVLPFWEGTFSDLDSFRTSDLIDDCRPESRISFSLRRPWFVPLHRLSCSTLDAYSNESDIERMQLHHLLLWRMTGA